MGRFELHLPACFPSHDNKIRFLTLLLLQVAHPKSYPTHHVNQIGDNFHLLLSLFLAFESDEGFPHDEATTSTQITNFTHKIQLKIMKMLCSFSRSCSFQTLLLILLFLLLSPVFSTSQIDRNSRSNKTSPPNMDPLELETLFKIMETLSSDENWRVSYPEPCQPGSSWPGIECKITGDDNLFHVIRLDFGTPPNPICKKTATFPSEIFHLPYLESIFIFQCFTHTPTIISVSLNESSINSPIQQLSLRSNSRLIGSIPPQLSSLKSLQILTLSQNRLTGPIPVEIFSLSSLLRLDFSYNFVTGAIPFEIGNFRNIVGLDLSYNKFMGPIPSKIGQLNELQKLDLSYNSLTGSIPESIQQLHSLVFLDLSNNKLSGRLPDGLKGLQNLQYLLMEDNPMFISLPLEFSHLKKLQELRLGNCGYSGTIPDKYSELTNLSTLSLQNNRLSGEIPAGFGNLSHLYHLNLSRNFLNGVVPFNSSFLKRLGKNLDLSGNSGLCLSPSEAAAAAGDVHVGVDVCGNNKSGSSIHPPKKSEAPRDHITSFWFNVALIFLALNELMFSA